MAARFEALLKLRKSQEDSLRKNFAVANDHLLNQQRQLNFMKDVESKNKREWDAHAGQIEEINAMVLYENFFSGVQIQEKRQRRIISEIAVKVEEKRKVLAEAMKRRKTLEILIERELAELSEKLKKRESATMDEVASFQWTRKRHE